MIYIGGFIIKQNSIVKTSSFTKIFLIAALALLVSSVFTFSSVTKAQTAESETQQTEDILESTLEYNEDETYTFDRDQAIEKGMTEEEADVIEEGFDIDTGGFSTAALPALAVPVAVKGAAKAAAAGGAAAVGAAFMVDVYNTSTYTACENFYGENGAIDNFCESKGHV